MGKGKRVVLASLEDISESVLERYPNQIRELVRGRSGIYALYRNNNLYYAGLATNLMRRLKQQMRDHHKRKWNRFSIYVTVHDGHMKELESLLSRIVNPRGNKQTGKFSRSENLRPKLNKLIKAADDDQRARMMGGRLPNRRVKSKSARYRGANILGGIFDKAVPLRGYRGDYEYRGSLKRNGEVSYDGVSYPSPTAAAKAALGRRANGWAFWTYRDKNGEWVKLRTLKR